MGTLSSTLTRRKTAIVTVQERRDTVLAATEDAVDGPNTVLKREVYKVTRGVQKVSVISEEGDSLRSMSLVQQAFQPIRRCSTLRGRARVHAGREYGTAKDPRIRKQRFRRHSNRSPALLCDASPLSESRGWPRSPSLTLDHLLQVLNTSINAVTKPRPPPVTDTTMDPVT